MSVHKPIQLRRNTRAYGLALTDGTAGEVFVCTDTHELLIGTGTGFTPLVTNVRSTVTSTTASLDPDASADATVTVPASYAIYQVATNYPARVRLYLSSSQRTADAARPVTEDPEGDHGCILEVVTTSGVSSLDLSPVAIGACPTGTSAYLSITNLDTVARAVTVTLDVLSME